MCKLSGGSLRFLQLKRALGPISQRMLTRTLKKLERVAAVARTSTGSAGMPVIYSLTVEGTELLEALHGLSSWLRKHGYPVADKEDDRDEAGRFA